MLNAIFYVNDNVTKWRSLPHDLPKWQTVYDWRTPLTRDGFFVRLADEARTRDRLGKGVRPHRLPPSSTLAP